MSLKMYTCISNRLRVETSVFWSRHVYLKVSIIAYSTLCEKWQKENPESMRTWVHKGGAKTAIKGPQVRLDRWLGDDSGPWEMHLGKTWQWAKYTYWLALYKAGLLVHQQQLTRSLVVTRAAETSHEHITKTFPLTFFHSSLNSRQSLSLQTFTEAAINAIRSRFQSVFALQCVCRLDITGAITRAWWAIMRTQIGSISSL